MDRREEEPRLQRPWLSKKAVSLMKENAHSTSPVDLAKDRRRMSGSERRFLVTVAAAVERHFSAKHAIHNHEVRDGQQHAESPPDQPHPNGVGAGQSVLHSDVVSRVAAGGQQTRI